jgi:para-aminobenzoate synthetase
MRTVIIDNYDSFTFNLYQLIGMVNGESPIVVKNDQISWQELEELAPECLVISPGPGRPENDRDFGICRRAILEMRVPLLGVCLGHQGIAFLHGARVTHAPTPMHGRLSRVYHNGRDLFEGIPQGFEVVRYHSLIVSPPLPACLEETARTSDGISMSVRHLERPMWGVQFHPESICTEYGTKLMENFRDAAHRYWKDRGRETGPLREGSCQSRLRPNNPTKTSEWTVRSRKLDFCVDAEEGFRALFSNDNYAFWLDSSRAEPGLSRFSYMGAPCGENSRVIRYFTSGRRLSVLQRGIWSEISMNLFDYLNSEIASKRCVSPELPFDFNCGVVGYLGYELKAECGAANAHSSGIPDALLILTDRLIVVDHLEEASYLLFLGREGTDGQASNWFETTEAVLRRVHGGYVRLPVYPASRVSFTLKQPRESYVGNIHKALQYIRDGESYEICLTNKLYSRTTVPPFEFYTHLRRVNPAPYSAFLRFGDLAIACSSPERFLKIDGDGIVESKPIKGTLARSASPEEDERLRESLRMDIKSRAENLMIVDLLRNDLGTVCDVGTVHVPRLMAVETYATVHQLVSTIRGRLKEGVSAVDCFRKAFPGGSMTGAPKIRTMELIDKLESEARGIYSGSIGFFGLNGTADLNIVIRTAVFRSEEVSIGTGGAIVALSDPDAEFKEIMIKASAILNAFSIATDQVCDVQPQTIHQ